MKLIISHQDFKANNNFTPFFKGYVIFEERVFVDNEFHEVLKNHISSGSIFENLNSYNGNFILCFKKENKYFLISDRWGTYPIYYKLSKDQFIFSDNWKSVAEFSSRKICYTSLIESLAFGHALDNKTLLDDVFELQPGSIAEIQLLNGNLHLKENRYWNLSFHPQKDSFRRLIKQFTKLWDNQLDFYLNYIKDKSQACFVPLSGGLDSRVLINELDKRGIPSYAFSFGNSNECYEVAAATKVVNHLKNCQEHCILKLDQKFVHEMINSETTFDLISCSRSGQKELLIYNKFKAKAKYILPGFSGDFMAGSHLKYKMKYWQTKSQVIDYIINHKVSPIIKAQKKYSSEYLPLLRSRLEATIPNGPDLLSTFIRWDLENRQRKYILRPESTIKGKETVLFLPFFDYKLMDFFLILPFKYLLSTRLYVASIYKYLFKNNRALLTIERGKKVQKPILNGLLNEYRSKFNSILSNKVDIKNMIWDENINWNNVLDKLDLPEEIKEITIPNNVDGSYIFFIINIALFNKELME